MHTTPPKSNRTTRFRSLGGEAIHFNDRGGALRELPQSATSKTGVMVYKKGRNVSLAECEVRSRSRPAEFIAPAF